LAGESQDNKGNGKKNRGQCEAKECDVINVFHVGAFQLAAQRNGNCRTESNQHRDDIGRDKQKVFICREFHLLAFRPAAVLRR